MSTFTNVQKTSTNEISSYDTYGVSFPLESFDSANYVGQSFHITNTTLLDNVSFYLQNENSPVLDIYAYIYNHTGTYGVNGKPTGSPMAISDPISSSTLNSRLNYYQYYSSSYSESNYDDGRNISGIELVETTISDNSVGYIGGTSADTADEAFSTIFNVSSNIFISTVNAYLFAFNDSIGTMYAKIYNITGTPGVNALPTGSAIATSDPFDSSVLLGSSPVGTPATFTFSGLNQIQLSSGNYALVIYVGIAGQWGWDANDYPVSGTSAYLNGGVWTDWPLKFKYKIFGSSNKRTYDGIGQVFTNTNNITLTQAKFYVKKVGSPTGSAYVKLYAVSSGIPGAVWATSDAFDVSTLSTSMALATFTFSDGITMAGGVQYGIVLEYSGGDGENNYIVAGDDGSSPTDPNNFLLHVTGSWLYNSPPGVYQCCYYVIGESLTDYGGSFGSRLVNDNQWIQFNFTGTNRIELDSGSDYFLVIYVNDTLAENNTVLAGVGLTLPFPSGNWATSTDGSTWTSLVNIFCLDFTLNGVSQWENNLKSQIEFNNNNI